MLKSIQAFGRCCGHTHTETNFFSVSKIKRLSLAYSITISTGIIWFNYSSELMVHQLVDGSAPVLCRALLLCTLGLSIRALVHEEGQIMEKACHLKQLSAVELLMKLVCTFYKFN